MILAVASGKGGTGKTTIAVNLALAVDGAVRFLDCDVEEPNAHLFLKPDITRTQVVYLPVPRIDNHTCTFCGECAAVCQFSAIVSLKETTLTFPELCHGCGGCRLVCPEEAITEVHREVGVVEAGRSGSIEFVHGRLRVGEAMSPPLIRAVKQYAARDRLTIIDAPPGTSCPVIESVRNCDYAILVTEPTPFGRYDLELAVETMRAVGVPFGVVVNRSTIGDNEVQHYCALEDIEILLEIPHSREIAESCSRGEPFVSRDAVLRDALRSMMNRIAAPGAAEEVHSSPGH